MLLCSWQRWADVENGVGVLTLFGGGEESVYPPFVGGRDGGVDTLGMPHVEAN